MHPRYPSLPFVFLALVSFTACGAEGESAQAGPAAQQPASAGGATPSSVDAPGAASTVLVPTSSFALSEDAGRVSGVAISPDGSKIAVSTQQRLGSPVTLRIYDAASGEVLATTEADVVGLGRLHWMADDRLVSADRDASLAWRSWDGATLAELPSVPQDATCADGQADRNSGAVYSSDGMVSMNDVLCRVDTSDGSILRSEQGTLVGAERFWVLPWSGEVAVVHSPNPEVSLELVVLDGASLTPKSSSPISFGESVEAVGTTAWIANNNTRTARLEPGAIQVPYMSPMRASGAGTTFIYSNGMDDFVFVSARDGREIGTMPAGMNLSPFSDWSLDDSAFVRLTVDGGVEVYSF